MNPEQAEQEIEHWYKGPIKWVLAIFLILIILLWLIPNYAVKLDPYPKYIPTIEEVVPAEIKIENITNSIENRNDFLKFIDVNDPVIKQTADKIVTKACDSGKICHAKAIFYFVRNNFKYVSDPTAFEYLKTAKESLISKGGDCDDAVVLAANLLGAVGIRTRFVFILNHVYIQAYLPEALKKYKAEEEWVNLDLTCSYCEFGEIPLQNIDAERSYLG